MKVREVVSFCLMKDLRVYTVGLMKVIWVYFVDEGRQGCLIHGGDDVFGAEALQQGLWPQGFRKFLLLELFPHPHSTTAG